ncbi:hypothetical protein DN752_00240 [Echinicola strongylocentroti]|uniref:Phytanoyl-CoA dioxygenase n=1 Tax=Echinicola strongylocentroti TaxID=1795355 RepID=A0A2Z4ICV3_9BACT|nr:phytanoyl-CoA dioxygenase family protein [Echinicola strongylocentroti]AWW28694.1 hypothetical protein DN752_00240 [Echinicola strongylocentroti]
MAGNKKALIRYITIDKCLRDSNRRWTLNDLITACSEAMYHYEGVDKRVSKRTIQMDLQHMRSEEPGYNAPIVVSKKKFYSYEDPTFSIMDTPLTEQDSQQLTEVVDILKQYRDFTYFQGVNGLVQQLENEILTLGHSDPSSVIPAIENTQNEVEDINKQSPLLLNEQRLSALDWKLRERGSYIFPPIYTQNEIKLITEHIDKYLYENSTNNSSSLIHSLFQKIPELSPLIFNKNLTTILNAVDIDLFVMKAAVVDTLSLGDQRANNWREDITINVKNSTPIAGYTDWRECDGYYNVRPPAKLLKHGLVIRIHLEETIEENGALRILPGSHKKKLIEDEVYSPPINRFPAIAEVSSGGLHLMKPLLVHSTSYNEMGNSAKVIHIALNSLNLPRGLDWAEKHEIGMERSYH